MKDHLRILSRKWCDLILHFMIWSTFYNQFLLLRGAGLPGRQTLSADIRLEAIIVIDWRDDGYSRCDGNRNGE